MDGKFCRKICKVFGEVICDFVFISQNIFIKNQKKMLLLSEMAQKVYLQKIKKILIKKNFDD